MPGTEIRGIVASPVTPFASDNQVDGKTLELLIDFLIREGAHAIALPMHIGESLKLTSQERKTLIELAVEAADARVPILAHVSTGGTDESVELSRHAAAAGADGLVAITPYHWRPSDDAQVAHFTAIATATDLPVIGYNYPERLGVQLSTDVIRRVAHRNPNFVGLKDASLDMEYFTEVCRVAEDLPSGFGVFSGVEYVLPGMAVGAAGTFSACGGVAPRLVTELYSECAAGRYERARPLQHRLSRLYQIIKGGYPASIKAAMEIMGRSCGPMRGPAESLDASTVERLADSLGDLGTLTDEPHGW